MKLEIKKHKRLSEVVYDQLRQEILAGTILPGTRMMEIELSTKLGVSRTPIREALRKLEKEGLVVVEPRHGAYTSQVSKADMIGILEVRQHMDKLAASYAATRGTAADFAHLEDCAAAYEAATKTKDSHEIIKCDERFHEAIAEASHNTTLLTIVTELQDMVVRFRYMYYNDPDIVQSMIEEHKEIIAAIKSGKEDKASEVAGRHIDGLITFIEESQKLADETGK
ncbi:MAG: GntR family transcriptional regulator [Firmicutes bacterium]|nr:GntR family transcriptional regulator [Bacillota bacterium]